MGCYEFKHRVRLVYCQGVRIDIVLLHIYTSNCFAFHLSWLSNTRHACFLILTSSVLICSSHRLSSFSVADSDVWMKLIGQVTTKYVYLGRNVVHFTWFDRLERLVRQINNLNTYAVAGAYRAYHSGKVCSCTSQTAVHHIQWSVGFTMTLCSTVCTKQAVLFGLP